MAARATVHVMIHGRVQGVGFRYWLAEEAQYRRLSGWVRNRRDGRVEAVFAGDAALVEGMIATCKAGPRLAHVRQVEVLDDAVEAPDGFEIRPTA